VCNPRRTGTDDGSLTPVAVKGITTAIQVSAGDYHACALLSNHTVKCWGSNGSSQLGNGKTTQSLIPAPNHRLTG
jgi:alpha-tubulin suppressor-like RCC1 family protein